MPTTDSEGISIISGRLAVWLNLLGQKLNLFSQRRVWAWAPVFSSPGRSKSAYHHPSWYTTTHYHKLHRSISSPAGLAQQSPLNLGLQWLATAAGYFTASADNYVLRAALGTAISLSYFTLHQMES